MKICKMISDKKKHVMKPRMRTYTTYAVDSRKIRSNERLTPARQSLAMTFLPMRSYVRVAFPSSPPSEVMVAKTAQPRNDLSPPKANGSGSLAMEVAGRRMWKAL